MIERLEYTLNPPPPVQETRTTSSVESSVLISSLTAPLTNSQIRGFHGLLNPAIPKTSCPPNSTLLYPFSQTPVRQAARESGCWWQRRPCENSTFHHRERANLVR